MIEVDIETTGVQWYASETFLVQFYDGEELAVLRHPEQRDEIQGWLFRDDDFRAWNSKFDFHGLESAGYNLPDKSRWHDGMVQARLCAPSLFSVALKAVAGKLFGDDARDPEKELKTWMTQERARRKKAAEEANEPFIAPNYSDVPAEIMEPYAAQDVLLTRRVCDHYDMVMAASPDIAEVYEFETKVLGALYGVERRGMPMDREAVAKFEAHLEDRLDDLEARCIELAGVKTFKPGSTAQLAEALTRRGVDLSQVGKTPGGKPSMDAENLGKLDDELATAILEFRGETKVLGNYVHPMLHGKYESSLRLEKAPFITPAGRLHPNFRQLGAVTGRMSCADPNIQNWPRDDLRLRYLMRAEPGFKLVTADLDSIELRLFAAYAGEGQILRMILEGEDMHQYVADQVGLKDRQRTTGVESARQRGKTFNYSMIYGAGVNSLKSAFGVSTPKAREMLALYREAFPEVSRLQKQVERKLRTQGYVKTAWGQRMYIPPEEAYKGVNYLIQGTAAGLLKDALIKLDAQRWPVVAAVHDELIMHVEEHRAEEAAEALVEAMTNHPRITKVVPVPAEADIIDRWSHAKDPLYVPEFLTVN